ncbi:uncharacterized protein LOC144753850 [Lissotriton helveticus]
MGLLSGICILALCVNLGHATKIDPDHLKNIVTRFHEEFHSGTESHPGLKQFAFLMVLDKLQCSHGISSDFKPILPQKKAEESLNYIALKLARGVINNEHSNFCSETLMLFSNKGKTPLAREFAQLKSVRDKLEDGGCVIFYTTNTPCNGRCFGEGPFDIIGPLNEAPFDDWKNKENIDMYFVYTNTYFPKSHLEKLDKDKRALEYENFKACTKNGFQRLNENQPGKAYSIYQCDNNKCKSCDKNNNFCLVFKPLEEGSSGI